MRVTSSALERSAAISSAYVAAFNDYVRTDMRYGSGQTYKLFAETGGKWDFSHRQPGMGNPFRGATNVMPDLAQAMKYNPDLKVLVTGGYYDKRQKSVVLRTATSIVVADPTTFATVSTVPAPAQTGGRGVASAIDGASYLLTASGNGRSPRSRFQPRAAISARLTGAAWCG